MPSYDNYDNLVIDRVGTDDRVGRITMNRPRKAERLIQRTAL